MGTHTAPARVLVSQPLPGAAWGRAVLREPGRFSELQRRVLFPLIGLARMCSLGSAQASGASPVPLALRESRSDYFELVQSACKLKGSLPFPERWSR